MSGPLGRGIWIAVLAMSAAAYAADPAVTDESAPAKAPGRRPRVERVQPKQEAGRPVAPWRERIRMFFQKRAEMNRAFFEKVKGLPPEERREAIRQHREEMRARTEQVVRRFQAAQMAGLKERLAKMSRLTDEDRAEILKFAEHQWQMAKAFHQEIAKAGQAAAEKIRGDNSLTPEQRREAFRAQREKMGGKIREHQQEMKQERQEFRERMREKIQKAPGQGPMDI